MAAAVELLLTSRVTACSQTPKLGTKMKSNNDTKATNDDELVLNAEDMIDGEYDWRTREVKEEAEQIDRLAGWWPSFIRKHNTN